MQEITSELCEKCKYGTHIRNTYKDSLYAWCCGYSLITHRSRVFRDGKKTCPPGYCDSFEPIEERKNKPVTWKKKI